MALILKVDITRNIKIILIMSNFLSLEITYKETKDVDENIILSQSRAKGDPIYEGYTLKITVSKKLEDKKLEDKKDNTEALLPSDNE